MAKRALTGRQLAFLFASKILSRSGGGKGGKGKGEVTYNKDRAKTLSSLRKRGVDVTSRKGAQRFNHNSAGAKRDPILARSALGMKAAHLRGSGSSGGRRVPSKAERDATRAERIRKGRDKFQDWADPYSSRLRKGTRAPRTERAQQFMERVEKDKHWYNRGGAADPKKGTRAAAAAYKREREDARLVKTPGALAGLPRAKRIARARQIVATERKVVEAIRNREESKANKLYADMQRQTKYRARPRDWAATTKRLMRFLPG